ncbi:MAG: argininosuccinate lyase [bacterium]
MKADTFMSSLSFDIRLAPYDIKGSIAHAKMLGKCGIIESAESEKIIKGLQDILKTIKKGGALPDEDDVHMAVEKELIKRIGAVGGKLHTARSRNDQIALDLRLYVKDALLQLEKFLVSIQKNLIAAAKKYSSLIMPGMTHLQHGQPVLCSHHLLAYAWMFQRDKERAADLFKRVDVCPLGSAALAGTSFPIDRAYTAKLLGFASITENSMDAVSDRDFLLEFLSNASIMMMHVSRLAEEIIVWSSSEFGFVSCGEAFTTGSSIMPQKRNPDFAEIVRGKTGRVYGSLMGMLTLLKGLPLTYNRDLQEDKPLLFDAVDTLRSVLGLTGGLIASLAFNSSRIAGAVKCGFLEATELADFLSKKGLPFRTAHGIVKKIVDYCIKKHTRLASLPLADLKKFSKHFNEESLKLLDLKTIVQSKKSYGGTSPGSVSLQIKKLQKLV